MNECMKMTADGLMLATDGWKAWKYDGDNDDDDDDNDDIRQDKDPSSSIIDYHWNNQLN